MMDKPEKPGDPVGALLVLKGRIGCSTMNLRDTVPKGRARLVVMPAAIDQRTHQGRDAAFPSRELRKTLYLRFDPLGRPGRNSMQEPLKSWTDFQNVLSSGKPHGEVG